MYKRLLPFQHITEPTRQRGSDKPSTLDLILTNEANMISDIKIDSPIGASDHSFISFNLNCNIQSTPPKIKVMYVIRVITKRWEMNCAKLTGMNYFILIRMMLTPSGSYSKTCMKKWRKNVILEKMFSLTGFNPTKTFYTIRLGQHKKNKRKKQTPEQNQERPSLWGREISL